MSFFVNEGKDNFVLGRLTPLFDFKTPPELLLL